MHTSRFAGALTIASMLCTLAHADGDALASAPNRACGCPDAVQPRAPAVLKEPDSTTKTQGRPKTQPRPNYVEVRDRTVHPVYVDVMCPAAVPSSSAHLLSVDGLTQSGGGQSGGTNPSEGSDDDGNPPPDGSGGGDKGNGSGDGNGGGRSNTEENPPAQGQGAPGLTEHAFLLVEIVAMVVMLVIAVGLGWRGMQLLKHDGLKSATEALLFRRHWGGFGGDSSGWNVSAPLGRCLTGLVLVAIGATLVVQTLLVLHDHEEAKSGNQQQTVSAAAPTKAADTGGAASDDGFD